MFGRLYVESLHEKRKQGSKGAQRFWRCRCLCGNFTLARTGALKIGHKKSCGCLQRESVIKRNAKWGIPYVHKNSTGSYNIWMSMRGRCTNPNHPAWHRYGGRGIKVCRRWMQSYDNFFKDMGFRPRRMSLDRIDNDGPYSKKNCRWATRFQQSVNKSTNHRLTYKGRTQTLTEWANEIGIRMSILSHRIGYGWSAHRALTEPPREWPKRKST